MQNNNNRILLLILAGALLLLCCCCVVAGGVAGVSLFGLLPGDTSGSSGQPVVVVTRIATAPAPRTTSAPASTPPAPGPAMPPGSGSSPELQGIPPLSAEEQALLADEMPAADARELALRLNPGVGAIPVTVNDVPPKYKVGDTAQFWVSNSDEQEHHQITAELRYVTDHVAMWVEKGVRMNQSDLEASANRFEKHTYPTNREFFGSEWTPGVDNDVRLHILHARNMGETIAGYYSSADEYSKAINPYSNEREMFYISADSGNARPNSDFYDGTLAHEFQHMIHWYNDRNEDSWVNEGLSELASYLNGFDPGGADMAYAEQPDTQLNTWADPSQGNAEHYGASYLFMTYFLDRFGEGLTKTVVASPKNGIAGFNDALEKAGRPERFDEIFADWVLANYLNERNADAEGRYGYAQIALAPVAVSETYRRYPASAQAQVSQYGADYIRLKGSGPVTIDFQGQQQAKLVDAQPQGQVSWWSNRGDQSDSTLTRTFDLRNTASATLDFSIWYDIEEGWDYAYVEASTDGGEHWQILPGRHTTENNPVGNAFGAGWTGISGGGKTPVWIKEQIDLTPYAGQEVQVRFEYVTDDAVNGPGVLLDNFAVPEIGYKDDAEGGAAGWAASGWTQTDNTLSQRWLVQLLEVGDGQVTVQRMVVGPDGRGQLTVSDLGNLREALLVISGLTPVTTEPASYSYTLTQ